MFPFKQQPADIGLNCAVWNILGSWMGVLACSFIRAPCHYHSSGPRGYFVMCFCLASMTGALGVCAVGSAGTRSLGRGTSTKSLLQAWVQVLWILRGFLNPLAFPLSAFVTVWPWGGSSSL